MKKYVHLQTMCYERITYPNFSSIKPIPSKKGYRKIKKRTKYRYDALNRITGAIDDTGNYNLTSVAYDKNGNITALNRKGHINTEATLFGNMDLLVYGYETNSNKLKKVTDTSGKSQGFNDGVNQTTEYTYDTNGNLLTDANKGITGILYNHLNLPTEIKFNNSSTKKINYTYDAIGIKLKKVVNDGGVLTTTDYAGNFVYENNTLQFFNHPEGYVHNDNGIFKYVYNYLDHLGSIRLSYSDGDGNGSISQSEIIKENHYYPYGLKLRGFNTGVSSLGNSLAQKYMFNGKEFDDSFNETLNTYDFGARNYDPALGCWMNLDPLAEQMRRHSPYNYAFNNPIYFIDPDGMAPVGGPGDWLKKKVNQAKTAVKNEVKRRVYNAGVALKDKVVTKMKAAKTVANKAVKDFFTDENSSGFIIYGLLSGTGMEADYKGKGAVSVDVSKNIPVLSKTKELKDEKRGSIDSDNTSGEVSTKKVDIQIDDIVNVIPPQGGDYYGNKLTTVHTKKKDTAVFNKDKEKVINDRKRKIDSLRSIRN